MKPEFKKIAATEIEQFKKDYKIRFPGRSVEKVTDEDLLREVMNTVGKTCKLGEQVKCVVSVSMLTEGWDANTVTHILGVRAFGTQLLCEQVVGRGLRRASYEIDPESEKFPPEYAEVYGVPFSFIPSTGTTHIQPPPILTHVRALEERSDCKITFPRLIGYRYPFDADKITPSFDQYSHYTLPPRDIPTETYIESITGDEKVDKLPYSEKRIQEVEYLLTQTILEKYFREDMQIEKSAVKWWLFPRLLEIVRLWMQNYLHYKDNAYPQMLMIDECREDAASKISVAINTTPGKVGDILPILIPDNPVGSTCDVNFETARPVYPTDPKKCHISHVVADTETWEQKTAQALEQMDEVVHYVKNHKLDFTIPYIAFEGTKQYTPDFIVKVETGDEELLNLVLEVSGLDPSGKRRKNKDRKADTTKNLWVKAVNNAQKFGRWDFLEIFNPWTVQNTIRAHLNR